MSVNHEISNSCLRQLQSTNKILSATDTGGRKYVKIKGSKIISTTTKKDKSSFQSLISKTSELFEQVGNVAQNNIPNATLGPKETLNSVYTTILNIKKRSIGKSWWVKFIYGITFKWVTYSSFKHYALAEAIKSIAHLALKREEGVSKIEDPMQRLEAKRAELISRAKNCSDSSTAAPIFYDACTYGCEAAANMIVGKLDVNNSESGGRWMLSLATARKWPGCVKSLVQRGASLKTECDAIATQFGAEFFQSLSDLVPLDSPKTADLIAWCYSQRISEAKQQFANRLLEKLFAKKEKPQWWSNKQMTTAIFESGLPYIVKNQGDTFLQLVQQMLSSSKEVNDFIIGCIVHNKPQCASALLNRLEALAESAKPIWWTTEAKADLFFKVSALKKNNVTQETMQRLISDVDVTTVGPGDKTTLMIASERDFGGDKVAELIQKGASLAQRDDAGRSAFSYVAGTRYTLNPSLVTPFLKNLGVTETELQAYSSWNTLCAYVSNGIFNSSQSTLIGRISCALLFKDFTQLDMALQSLKNKAYGHRLEAIDKICAVFSEKECATLVDKLFTTNISHYSTGIATAEVSQKKSGVSIDEMLTLYTAYAKVPDSIEIQWLKEFTNKVKNKTPYLGTPPKDDRAALNKFYTTIDNAICNVVSRFKEAEAKLSQKNGGKTVKQLAEEGSKEARDLVSDIRVWLQECAYAAPFCGGRIYTNAVQQHTAICLSSVDDDVTTFCQKMLASERERIASSLFLGQRQSVHIYIPFMRLHGKSLGIPGASVMSSFTDIFSHANEEAEVAKEIFQQRYTPSAMVEALKATFYKNGAYRELMQDYLGELASTKNTILSDWNERTSNKLIAEVTGMWNDSKLTKNQQKEKIEAFLGGDPYFLTLLPNDLSSLDNIVKEIKAGPFTGGRLFKAQCMTKQVGKNPVTLTSSSIIVALSAMKVLQ